MIRPTVLALALLVLTALPSFADEIQLKNGDRITGTFVSMVNGVVTWKGAGANNLKINWADVTSINVDNPVYVTVRDLPPVVTGISPGDAAGRGLLEPGGPVNLADIVSIT